MSHIDTSYINLLARDLKNFRQTKPTVWNFSCPMCGDSKKNTSRARGYIYRMELSYNYMCHNCGERMSFKNFLKEEFSSLYEQYQRDCILSIGKEEYVSYTPVNKTFIAKENKTEQYLNNLIRLDTLVAPNPVLDIIGQRKIPKDKYNLLYYANRYKQFSNMVTPGSFTNMYGDCPRLAIPFFTEQGEVFIFSFRAFDNAPTKYKYITIKVDNNKAERIYGLERVNWDEDVYMTEGPLDSLFLPNAIASGGGFGITDTMTEHKDNIIIIPDNEPRNPHITKSLQRLITAGFRMFIFPYYIKGKDLNDCIMYDNINEKSLLKVVKDNTFSGLELQARFDNWKKVIS